MPQTSQLPELDQFTQLTYLIRLIAILKQKTGGEGLLTRFSEDAIAQQFYQETAGHEVDFIPLDAIAAVLVQEHEVVAACYRDPSCIGLTIMGSSDIAVENSDIVESSSLNDDEDPQENAWQETDEEGNKSTRPLTFTILANPFKRHGSTDHSQNTNHHQLRVIPPTDGHWEAIKKDSYFCLMHSVSLESHVATVVSYLKDYQKDKKLRSQHSRSFFKYLLSVCWRKLYRRISSWQGLGFACVWYTFLDMREEVLGKVSNPSSDLASDDNALAKFLLGNPNVILSLQDAFSSFKNESQKKHGEISFEGLIEAAKNEKALYTQDTVREFHYLVWAAFVQLGSSLRRLSELYKSCSNGLQNLQQAFDLALDHTRLLLCVLTSGSIKNHLDHISAIMGYNDLYPSYDNRPLYMQFGMNCNILKPKSNYEDIDHHDPAIAVPSEASAHDRRVYLTWIRVFVFQFIGKRVLERHCAHLPNTIVSISILAVNRCKYTVPSWDMFKGIIYAALERNNCQDPEQLSSYHRVVVARLEEALQKINLNRLGNTRNTVETFRKVFKGEKVEYVAGVHCEAVLAALWSCKPHLEGDDELLRICHSLQGTHISVSKLCCPVCWELLGSLRNSVLGCQNVQEPQLLVRGCHSAIFPVVLPAWLDNDTRTQMTRSFQTHLCKELNFLMGVGGSYTLPLIKGHRPNQLSITEISASSSRGYDSESSVSEPSTRKED